MVLVVETDGASARAESPSPNAFVAYVKAYSGLASRPTLAAFAKSTAVSPLKGWRQSGAISARGPMTNSR